MTPAALLLALAMAQQPECRARPADVNALAPLVLAAEDAYQLPRGLLASVVLAESGATPLVRVRRGVSSPGWACDVGVAGIGVPGCQWAMVAAFLNPAVNLHEGARQLAASRSRCSRSPGWPLCKRSEYQLYNAYSKTWWNRVESIWNRIKIIIEERAGLDYNMTIGARVRGPSADLTSHPLEEDDMAETDSIIPEEYHARFWAKVHRHEGCWEWLGARFRSGYGAFHIPMTKNRVEYAHRVSYSIACGRIPDGADILHSCDNPGCVNPRHLRVGDAIDNAMDMIARGRGRNQAGVTTWSRGRGNRWRARKREAMRSERMALRGW